MRCRSLVRARAVLHRTHADPSQPCRCLAQRVPGCNRCQAVSFPPKCTMHLTVPSVPSALVSRAVSAVGRSHNSARCMNHARRPWTFCRRWSRPCDPRRDCERATVCTAFLVNSHTRQLPQPHHDARRAPCTPIRPLSAGLCASHPALASNASPTTHESHSNAHHPRCVQPSPMVQPWVSLRTLSWRLLRGGSCELCLIQTPVASMLLADRLWSLPRGLRCSASSCLLQILSPRRATAAPRRGAARAHRSGVRFGSCVRCQSRLEPTDTVAD